MRRFLFLGFLLLLGTGCIPSSNNNNESVESTVTFPQGVVVHVDIADTEWERIQGLSGTPYLPDDEGLLFLHDTHAYQNYWMKRMLIPIDIIWIDNDRVVGFVEDAQPENPPVTIYTSDMPVDKVLEVPAGFVAVNSVKIGDILDINVVQE